MVSGMELRLQDMSKATKLALESKEMRSDLRWLHQSLQASYGPFGVAALFQPSPGGHVTVTARSEKILQLLKMKNPVLKVLTTAVQTLAQRYHDCGLFAALLSINLILNGMELGLPRHKVAMVTSYALSLVSNYLGSDQCLCRCSLELSSAEQMMNLVRSYLCTKSALCALSNTELNHIASLVLQGFLQVIPTASDDKALSVKDRLHLHSITGQLVTHSKLIQGLLIECSDVGAPGNESGAVWNISVKRDQERLVVTALFDASMAGDPSEEFPRSVELVSADPTVMGSRMVEDVIVQQLMIVAENLVQEGVGLVGCQKCIHPLIKEYLREQDVVVVDRLSAFHIGSVRDITGGQLISSFSLQYPHHWLGRLKDIRHTTVKDRRYLVLEGYSAHSSLVLCCNSEVVADELKPLCSAAILLLEQSLHHPYIFYGGGCMETFLCHFLEEKASKVNEQLLLELQCDQRTFSCVMKSVAHSFASVSASLEHYGGLLLTDTTFYHSWSFPPYSHCESNSTSNTNGVRGKMETKSSPKQSLFNGKTCSCGAVKLGDLPAGTTWQTLFRDDFIAVPEIITELLRSRGQDGGLPDGYDHASKEGLIQVSDSEYATITADETLSSAVVSHSNVHCSDVEACKETKHPSRSPLVCDPFLPKLKAVELANDLSCSILRIAYALTENI